MWVWVVLEGPDKQLRLVQSRRCKARIALIGIAAAARAGLQAWAVETTAEMDDVVNRRNLDSYRLRQMGWAESLGLGKLFDKKA